VSFGKRAQRCRGAKLAYGLSWRVGVPYVAAPVAHITRAISY